ncbi:cob(I)yrinic acid a,c-diamide adenosyltransferase [Ornithinimicrobium sp. F0845]|uniref:cob(I)yrinic acid a,c-diamide adenosyltransferase n=1 Tax=Ornithinimicrobium sp. F0845 TaxID=2926412 RepID=UPI001FF35A88|nr:cob(I)yrinic acid a,c-diamide adenosyltransferase [Ornithinimicrobium sp. F0845]MCK0112532.1 cob(I)yrinic acid a,c-diamide adenosyltransferase [Ornithinimicrobium sp. F0845]
MTEHAEPRTERPYDRRELRSAPSLVLVNTGHGKGKSTAAFGTLLRSRGRDWPTAVVQFIKSGRWRTGEEAMMRQLGVDWFAAGDGFSWESDDLDESRAKAVAAWTFSRALIAAGSHRMILLDEISYPLNWGWIDIDEVTTVLRERPEDVSVFLTGREMPGPIVEVADTVTEMVPVKHAFQQGIRARRGIDY